MDGRTRFSLPPTAKRTRPDETLIRSFFAEEFFDGYFAVFEWVWRGQTPGKRWLKLRVIREDGRPISFFEAMIRNLLRVVDIIFPPFYSIGLISVFASARDQRVLTMGWSQYPKLHSTSR